MAEVTLQVVDAKGKKSGTKSAAESVVGTETRPDLLHQVVRWQRAGKRAGTHSTLTRTEVRGGGAKPWRQKGTGRARAGSSSSPVWVSGGVAHGPKPRDYSFSLNRKMKKKALCSAISTRVQEEKCLLLKEFGLKEIKTKEAAAVLAALGIERGKRALVVVSSESELAAKSLRNLPRVKVTTENGLTVYEILNAEFLVFEEAAFDAIHERLQ